MPYLLRACSAKARPRAISYYQTTFFYASPALEQHAIQGRDKTFLSDIMQFPPRSYRGAQEAAFVRQMMRIAHPAPDPPQARRLWDWACRGPQQVCRTQDRTACR